MSKNVNDQEFEELLRFYPIEVKQKSTVSLEHAHNVKACRVPISVSSMPFPMGSERSQTRMPSFPDIVVIVNTQDFVWVLSAVPKCEIKAEDDENLTDANDRWVKIICERKQGQLSNFTYTMGDLGGKSSFFVGLGVVGLAAAEGARVSGASRIICVDLNTNRFEGGSIAAMISAFECVHDGWGVAILVGVPNRDDAFKTFPMNILNERTLKSTFFGNNKPRSNIPRELEVEKFITHAVPFSEINKAFDLMLKVEGIRCIINMDG
ncbi:hypothetical protein GIB67_001502 [Kingdonia uniflora]|uniref:Uncharacterized protein n=1 Tax=Kingdonia uniflora TaxID=39325 RepID=A0A7J7MND9_9MAGN|nr:hypothetical protein GIB67_001502 [Kingdonia uniflora]